MVAEMDAGDPDSRFRSSWVVVYGGGGNVNCHPPCRLKSFLDDRVFGEKEGGGLLEVVL